MDGLWHCVYPHDVLSHPKYTGFSSETEKWPVTMKGNLQKDTKFGRTLDNENIIQLPILPSWKDLPTFLGLGLL